MIIGISGKAGCGKTTFARMLADRLNCERLSFADGLRQEVAELFGVPMNYMRADRETKDAIKLDLGFRKATLRELMQWWGTVRREGNPNYWIEKAFSKTHNWTFAIIDDLRYLNEAQAILSGGGLLFRLEPYKGWTPGVGADHQSETDLDGFLGFTEVLFPVKGGLGAFVEYVARLAERRAGCEVFPEVDR